MGLNPGDVALELIYFELDRVEGGLRRKETAPDRPATILQNVHKAV